LFFLFFYYHFKYAYSFTTAMTCFQDKWLEAVKALNSVVCCRLDEAQPHPDADTSLPAKGNLGVWAYHFVSAVAPYCPAILTRTPEMTLAVKDGKAGRPSDERTPLCIEDICLDQDATSERAILHSIDNGADAISISPHCDNVEAIVDYCHARGLGVFIDCLRNGNDRGSEKNSSAHMLLSPHETRAIFVEDKLAYTDCFLVKQPVWATTLAYSHNADGIVCGAPHDNVSADDVKRIARYAGRNLIVLCPNPQGDIDTLFKYFGPDRVLLSWRWFQSYYYDNHHQAAKEIVATFNGKRESYRPGPETKNGAAKKGFLVKKDG